MATSLGIAVICNVWWCIAACVSTGAWNVVHLRGEARVLVPRLVTGLKIWHMRQAGIFYPKHSFLTTMANLPDGAQVRKPPAPPSGPPSCHPPPPIPPPLGPLPWLFSRPSLPAPPLPTLSSVCGTPLLFSSAKWKAGLSIHFFVQYLAAH